MVASGFMGIFFIFFLNFFLTVRCGGLYGNLKAQRYAVKLSDILVGSRQ